MPLKILITNNRFAKRTGTELYVLELAEELLRRGERPAIYSPHVGGLADVARSRTIPVAARLDQIGFAPDVIHGHHAHQVTAASLRFPRVPVVFVSHGWGSSADAPPPWPRIRRFVAVDATCRDRLVCECGVPEELTEVHPNFVNLARFRPRESLPERPRRAVLFTNRGRFAPYVATLRNACRSRGISLDLLGAVSGRDCERPEDVLGRYDLVFGRAKAAIEAMAVGTAVVLCDRRGLGPLVTVAEFERLRSLNFGWRSLSRPLTTANVGAELDRYDPRDAQAVSERIRQVAPLTLAVDRLLDLYHAVIAEHAAQPVDWNGEFTALSAYFEALRPAVERGERPTAWDHASRLLALARHAGRSALAEPAGLLTRAFRRAA